MRPPPKASSVLVLAIEENRDRLPARRRQLAASEPRHCSPPICAGGGLADEGDDIEVLELRLDEALAMIERGEIVDGKTIMLLQDARLNLFTTRTTSGERRAASGERRAASGEFPRF